jgi:hypothetical protein
VEVFLALYNSQRRIENFEYLGSLNYGIAIKLFFLHLMIHLRGVTVNDLCERTGKGRTYVKAILDAEPAPYGPTKKKEGSVFLHWIEEGIDLLDSVL